MIHFNKIVGIFYLSFVFGAEYYVSNSGSIDNPGTFDNPFLKVQQAADIMQAGDICYIRQGVYHEQVLVNNQDGALGSSIMFSNYQDERVVFDGTVIIDSVWVPYNENIWTTEIDFDIWQLFCWF